jgi:hypothetical protein
MKGPDDPHGGAGEAKPCVGAAHTRLEPASVAAPQPGMVGYIWPTAQLQLTPPPLLLELPAPPLLLLLDPLELPAPLLLEALLDPPLLLLELPAPPPLLLEELFAPPLLLLDPPVTPLLLEAPLDPPLPLLEELFAPPLLLLPELALLLEPPLAPPLLLLDPPAPLLLDELAVPPPVLPLPVGIPKPLPPPEGPSPIQSVPASPSPERLTPGNEHAAAATATRAPAIARPRGPSDFREVLTSQNLPAAQMPPGDTPTATCLVDAGVVSSKTSPLATPRTPTTPSTSATVVAADPRPSSESGSRVHRLRTKLPLASFTGQMLSRSSSAD